MSDPASAHEVQRAIDAAHAARSAGDLVGAAAQLEAALSLAPRRVDLWIGLAELRHTLADDDAALAACGRALRLAPDDADALNLQALALVMLGRMAEAELVLRRILARHAHHLPARGNLASLLERSNRLAEAERLAREGLRIAPHEPLLNLVVAQCLLRARDLDGCETFLARVEALPAPGLLPQHAAFLRARLLDARGDVDAAFAAFSRANARQLEQYRRAHPGPNPNRVQLGSELATFTAPWVEGWRHLPRPAPLPFRLAFLIGFPRSGTTLLDQILDAHPQVTTLEEQPFVERLLNSVPGGYPEGLAQLDASARDALRQRYVEQVLERLPQPGAVVVDKFPLKLTKAGFLQRIFPEARFVLALRHPYDVVLSCFMQEFGMNDAMANLCTLDDAAAYYDLAFSLWQRYREIFPLEVREVRYERLVEDLPGELAPALEHLGVGWDERVTGFAEHARARGHIRTPSYSQVSQALYTSARGRHLKYLRHFSPAAQRLLDPWVDRLGYQRPG